MKHRRLLESTYDVPWHSRLLGAFVGVVVVSGVLTILAGGFFINRMVIGEAQRRVELGLKTAHAILGQRLNEARRACQMMAEELADASPASLQPKHQKLLNRWRILSGFDYLHVVNRRAVIVASARGRAAGTAVNDGQVVVQTLRQRKPAAGVCLIPLSALALEDVALAERARIKVLPTPRAKPGGPTELKAALVYEAAAPIVNDRGELTGAVRVGTVLNGNFDFVDFVRENIFTVATYGTKNLGTVTIFQGDVRIATNVKGPDGKRAVGTRISAEVYDRVLGAGKRWTGPAFVVGSWYISAYEPLRDPQGRIVGILYVGVLKDRYDDMRNQALGLFVFVSVLALIGAVLLAKLIATRLVHPLTQLT
ncbi:MAG: cache domain-containing protein, partial [Abditibacteriales bacterium]|nr:cache domain-containing protein [Abditibacteriales bacterium]MDW8368291.1 cache domain-containing protein [Abditibacteriales bacterium]